MSGQNKRSYAGFFEDEMVELDLLTSQKRMPTAASHSVGIDRYLMWRRDT